MDAIVEFALDQPRVYEVLAYPAREAEVREVVSRLRASFGPLFWAALENPMPGMPTWGAGFKEQLAAFRYTMLVSGHGTRLRDEAAGA